MIAKFLSRQQWEAKLRRWGCTRLEGAGELNTAEFWRGPNGGYPFTVPVEDDGSCDFWAIQQIVADFGRPPPPNPFKDH